MTAAPVSDDAHTPARQPVDLFGMATFWSVVLTAALATVLLYCWPAGARIARQAEALDEAEQKLAAVRERHDELAAECQALDDPFYIERILRFEYNWRPETDDR